MTPVLLDLGRGKRSDISDLLEGEGKYIEKINGIITDIQNEGIVGEVRIITVVLKTRKEDL